MMNGLAHEKGNAAEFLRNETLRRLPQCVLKISSILSRMKS